jgi:hypothetical protein
MNTLPYQQAFERIHAEYLEMPGMRLTPEQVQRLCGVDSSVCRLVLDDLLRAKFLRVGSDGSYARATEGGASKLRTAKAEWAPSRIVPSARRAG